MTHFVKLTPKTGSGIKDVRVNPDHVMSVASDGQRTYIQMQGVDQISSIVVEEDVDTAIRLLLGGK